MSRIKFLTGIFLSASFFLLPGCVETVQKDKCSSSAFYSVPDSVEQKAQELLKQMTLEEKVLQLASNYPNGNTRLGIPHIQAGECLHGVTAPEATLFPQAIGMGTTWDPELIGQMGVVVAKEARALGIQHFYSPMFGLARDPRWGRADESYGEDPYLVSRIGVAYINGLQGRGKDRFGKDHIFATAKHYVADGEPLVGDNGANVEISKRYLHETHLIPFEAAVKEAGVGSIMPAHHELNGVPCHVNSYLLSDVLRCELGFDGLIVSDNNDILRAHTYLHYGKSVNDVLREALELGVATELASSTDTSKTVTNLFDGDPKNKWTPEKGVKKAWIEVDLGEDVKIGNTTLAEPWHPWHKNFQKFELQVKIEDKWETVSKGEPGGYGYSLDFEPVSGRYFRLIITGPKDKEPVLNEWILFRAI